MTELRKGERDMVLFTAPSGAGKTTIVTHLIKTFRDELSFSISATTRSKRMHEEDGKDYFFYSNVEFAEAIKNSEFVEFEEVYEDKYYGTLKSEVQRIKEEGKKVIFDIDVKGASTLKSYYGERCLAVFVNPPSFEVLVQRLTNRRTETATSLKKRINRIKKELTYRDSFDLILLNDKLEVALEDAENIIEHYLLGKK